MADVTTQITVSSDNESNIYQRLQQIGDELEALENHKEKLDEMGYDFQVSTDAGDFVANIQDQ